MALPSLYTIRNLWTRRLTTALTALGMALVVYVYATVLMLSEGLRQTLVETGSEANAIAIRKAADTEVQSSVDRNQAAVVESQPEIALSEAGQRLVSKETVVLMVLRQRGSDKPSNVTLRGIPPQGLELRPQVRLVAGRMFRPGSTEIVAGRRIAERFAGAGLGETLHFGQQTWTVVGLFEAGSTAFGSEIWGDVDQFMQAFRRNAYSAVLFRLNDPNALDSLRRRLQDDPRLTVELKRETRFYAEQSEVMARFLRILGLTLSIIFSIGAVLGAMITLYASVASRTTEIGTLRALGFCRRDILLAFLYEAGLIGLVGGIAGLALASCMQWLTVSTMNWQTFSELSFSFSLTRAIALRALAFSVLMGLAGGLLPAFRAARMQIVDALRSV